MPKYTIYKMQDVKQLKDGDFSKENIIEEFLDSFVKIKEKFDVVEHKSFFENQLKDFLKMTLNESNYSSELMHVNECEYTFQKCMVHCEVWKEEKGIGKKFANDFLYATQDVKHISSFLLKRKEKNTPNQWSVLTSSLFGPENTNQKKLTQADESSRYKFLILIKIKNGKNSPYKTNTYIVTFGNLWQNISDVFVKLFGIDFSRKLWDVSIKGMEILSDNDNRVIESRGEAKDNLSGLITMDSDKKFIQGASIDAKFIENGNNKKMQVKDAINFNGKYNTLELIKNIKNINYASNSEHKNILMTKVFDNSSIINGDPARNNEELADKWIKEVSVGLSNHGISSLNEECEFEAIENDKLKRVLTKDKFLTSEKIDEFWGVFLEERVAGSFKKGGKDICFFDILREITIKKGDDSYRLLDVLDIEYSHNDIEDEAGIDEGTIHNWKSGTQYLKKERGISKIIEQYLNLDLYNPKDITIPDDLKNKWNKYLNEKEPKWNEGLVNKAICSENYGLSLGDKSILSYIKHSKTQSKLEFADIINFNPIIGEVTNNQKANEHFKGVGFDVICIKKEGTTGISHLLSQVQATMYMLMNPNEKVLKQVKDSWMNLIEAIAAGADVNEKNEEKREELLKKIKISHEGAKAKYKELELGNITNSRNIVLGILITSSSFYKKNEKLVKKICQNRNGTHDCNDSCDLISKAKQKPSFTMLTYVSLVELSKRAKRYDKEIKILSIPYKD